jgi:nicotinamide-nucleotide amidase
LNTKQLLIKKIKDSKMSISVAESCTGGQLSAAFVSQAGASEFFLGGIVTYSTHSKIDILKIDSKKIKLYGVVSQEIANEMSLKVKDLFNSDISISTTGNAGPILANPNDVTGRIFISVRFKDKFFEKECNFNGERNENIISTVDQAISLLNNIL